MQKDIQCATLVGSRIENYGSIQDLMQIAGDEVFLIDMNAIKKGKPNFKFYQEFTKYFDVYVLSLVNKIDDLLDTLILGCEGVVISPRLDPRMIKEFLAISENLIMPYTSLPSTRDFSRFGGRDFLTNTLVSFPFDNAYYYGPGLPGDKYIRLKDFPLEQQSFALEE